MTIVHLMVGFGGGGAEHFVLELVKQNRAHGMKVIVIGVTSINMIEDKFLEANIEPVSLNIDGFGALAKGVKKFLSIVKNEKDVVIHAHMFHALMIASFTKLLNPKIPVVFTLHNNFVKDPYRKPILFLTKPLRNAEVIFSEDSRQWYHKADAVVIANGVNTEKFNMPLNPPERFTCLFLGRLEKQKNPLYLVELVLNLKDKCDFQISIAGQGILLDELQESIRKNGLERYFNFLGFRKDTPQLIASCNCLIMPSLWEGFPISIIEAGSVGIPILCTPVGSIPSLLTRENSYISNLQEFPARLQDMIENYDLALRKANKLKEDIWKAYDIKNSALKHHALYGKVSKAENQMADISA